MNISEIREYLQPKLQKVDVLMRTSLECDIPLLNTVNQTVLSHGGKMMRPMLALLVGGACAESGELTEDTIRFAAASELLHNATLLHDDVADDSESRRGFPTMKALIGGRAAVLLGDYWLVKAMDKVLNARRHASRVRSLFAKTLEDLAQGEILQLERSSDGMTTEKDYYRTIYGKTASLFETAAVTSALSVNATDERVRAVREYAVGIGLAFQIKDDIFDYSSQGQIGKPVGIDLKEQKITLPLLGALRKAGPEEEKRIRAQVSEIHERPEYQAEVEAFVRANDGVAYAEEVLSQHILKAVEALRALPESYDRDCLEYLARYVGDRNL